MGKVSGGGVFTKETLVAQGVEKQIDSGSGAQKFLTVTLMGSFLLWAILSVLSVCYFVGASFLLGKVIDIPPMGWLLVFCGLIVAILSVFFLTEKDSDRK